MDYTCTGRHSRHLTALTNTFSSLSLSLYWRVDVCYIAL